MKDFLILTFQGVAAFAALAAVIVTILLNWNRLRRNSIFKPILPLSQKTFFFTTISRRNFMIVGALATGVIFWSLIHFRLAKKKLKKVSILDLIAQTRPTEDAIEILLLAAEGNPTSVHIYDKLIKLLGKIKRYESIHLLLKSAENDLSQILSGKKGGTKEHKKYLRALQHIQGQKEKALRNARNKTIAKCGPICLGETT